MNPYTRNKWMTHVRLSLIGGACLFVAIVLLLFTQVLTTRFSRIGFRVGLAIAVAGFALIMIDHKTRPNP
jgi:hypothetical protein